MAKMDWNNLKIVEVRKPMPIQSTNQLSEKERIQALCALIIKAYNRYLINQRKKGREVTT